MDEAMANEEIKLTPIGYFRSSQVHPYEAGRQPDEHHSEGVIELNSGHNFEQALIGLESCERIWIVFLFHHNNHWNPMVLPPRGVENKIGLFATRSPYRPNPIGMSCVRVAKIDKLKITVLGADILDGTPILDIKPYVASADSFPECTPAWLQAAEKFTVNFSVQALEQLTYLESQDLNQLRAFLFHQLEYEPTNSRKKRVKIVENGFIIAYRTWRASFTISDRQLKVENIFSGYSLTDLENSEDTYFDKDLHRSFNKKYIKENA